MRLRSLGLGLLTASLIAVGASRDASADNVSATRYEIVERSHVIDVRIDRGVATLVVTRTVANRGPRSDQAMFHLELPESAVATRLRTAGTKPNGEGVWFEGELMEAEAAAHKYQELTGIGGYYPKDPALLSWRNQGHLALQVFPVPPQATKSVEYTLKMPLEYKDGVYVLDPPALGTDAMKATLRVSSARPEDTLSVNGVRMAPGGAPIRVQGAAKVEVSPRATTMEGSLASIPVATSRHLLRARVSMPPRFGEVPRGAHVVVLFDNSRSMENPDAALAAVRSYLGHMTDATVDFLTFDRRVNAPFGNALSQSGALAKLAAYTPSLKNGSRVDDALAKADAILAASSATSKRVLLVTDTLTRSGLNADMIGAMPWKSGALLHTATVEGNGNEARRDDESPWSKLPRRTGGVFWNAKAPSLVDAATRETFEEWARPKRLDHVVVTGIPDFAAPDVLAEGEGIAEDAITAAPVNGIRVEGELWSKATSLAVTPSPRDNKLAAALVFGTDLYGQLSEPEQMKLAMLGGAVSPVTSYLAIEPGVRPSTEGLDESEIGLGGGSVGFGDGIGLGGVGTVGHGARVDRARWLAGQLDAAAKACKATAKEVSVSLESTRVEIVDVAPVVLSPTRDAKVEACIREELWNVRLTDAFGESFATWDVKTTL